MRLYKIMALMYADALLIKNTKWRLIEYFYFPISTILIYGFFALFINSYAPEAGLIVMIVNIMWSFAQVAQSSVNQSMNEDAWSGSLKQIMITGISDFEYITARVISATIISLVVLAMIIAISVGVFNIAIFVTQWQLFLVLTMEILIASIGLSILVAAAMIALGREYSFLAWSAMSVFILLSAPFYPISLFPEFIKPLVLVMPYSNIFEAVRGTITGSIDYATVWAGIYIALAYFVISLPLYRYVFKKAREKGWIVRLS